MRLWVACRAVACDLIGVFDEERLAVGSCTTAGDFVAEVTLNDGVGPLLFPYYPLHGVVDGTVLEAEAVPPDVDPRALASQARPSPTGPIG